MKNVTKSLTALLLALVMSLTLLPAQALAAERGTETASDGALLDGYLYQLAGMDIADYERGFDTAGTPAMYAASGNLTAAERAVYNTLKEQLILIANGQRKDTMIQTTGTLPDQTSADKVWQALLADLPYALYWHDKTIGIAYSCTRDNGRKDITFKFAVAAEFRGGSLYTTNIPNVPEAVAVAKQVVSTNRGKTDYGKLQAYRQYICDQVSYNSSINKDTAYGNPWQLLWVFDGDASTNVVCEGYAKAFKYLCDLTEESNGWIGSVETLDVTGTMDGGSHMWNVVRINGTNYLADVTNCDQGMVGYPTKLFLCGIQTKDSSMYHQDTKTKYIYDTNTINSFKAADLAVSAAGFDPGTAAVPADVKMSNAVVSGNTIVVTWEKAAGAATYVVYRKTADSKWVKLATVGSSTLKYADKTAARGVTYYYTVLALAADGKTKSGYDKAGVPAIIAPAKVELGKFSANAADVTITWTKADGADKYYVYRKDTKNTSWKKLAAVDSSTLKYVDKTVANGVQYTYTVLACAADGKTKGGYDSTGLTVMMVPAMVELSKATHSATNITVTWKAAAGAKTYRVYRKAAGESKWTTVAKSVSGTSYTDKTVKVGVKYTYTVKGIASDGKTLSAKYNAAGVSDTLPKGATPAKVELGKISANAAGVTITWTKADGADKYYVYRKDTKNTSWKKLAAVDSSTLKYVDKTVANGVQYTYTVLACAADGKTKGGYDSTGLTVMMVPAMVELSKATHSATNITVTWKAAAGAKTYRVYRKAAGESKWTTVAKSVSGTSYTDKTVKVGVKYTYTVKGIASDGKTLSAKYNAAGVSDTLPKGATPAKVTLTGISTDSAGITIRWQKAANATKYYVYRKDTTNTKWKKVAVVSSTGAASYSYKDTTVMRNVAYTYTVRGVSSDGQTMGGYNAAGKTAKVTASASATPAYVTMKDARRVTSGTKGIRLTWTTTNNAKTYNVYRAANPPKDQKGNPANVPTSKWKLVGQKVDALSFLDVTGKSGVTYAYTVRGVAANGKTLSTNYNTVGLRATMP